MTHRNRIARLSLLAAAATCAWALVQAGASVQPADGRDQPAVQPADCDQPIPYPGNRDLGAVTKWIRDESTRQAMEEYRKRIEANPPSPGSCGGTINVFFSPSLLPRPEWGLLADRIARDLEKGGHVSRSAAIGLLGMVMEIWNVDPSIVPGETGPLVAGLIVASDDAPQEIRIRALWSLGSRHLTASRPAAVVRLLEALGDEDRKMRAGGAASLYSIGRESRDDKGKFGGLEDRVATALMSLRDDPDRNVRLSAMGAIGHMGEAGRPHVPTLVAMYNGPPSGDRNLAGLALERLGPVAVDALPDVLKWMSSPEERVRCRACAILGGIGEKAASATPLLVVALGDPSENVPIYAIRALMEIGPPARAALPTLRAALARDPEAFGGMGRYAADSIQGRPVPSGLMRPRPDRK